MTLPEGWPTLQEIMRATAHLANGDAPDWHVNYRLTNAASFAVTAYPALVELVESIDRKLADTAWHPIYRNALTGVRGPLAAILALASSRRRRPVSSRGACLCRECGVHTCGACGAPCFCVGDVNGDDRCDHCVDERDAEKEKK